MPRRKIPMSNFTCYVPTHIKKGFEELARKQGSSASSLMGKLMREFCERQSENSEFKEELKKDKLMDIIDSGEPLSNVRSLIIDELKEK